MKNHPAFADPKLDQATIAAERAFGRDRQAEIRNLFAEAVAQGDKAAMAGCAKAELTLFAIRFTQETDRGRIVQSQLKQKGPRP